MSDIPEDVMKVAREVAWKVDSTDHPSVVYPIAHALVAERERCAIKAEAFDLDGAELLVAAAIRTPSVPVKETIA